MRKYITNQLVTISIRVGINLVLFLLARISISTFGGEKMKKLFSMFVAVAFALSMVGVAFAADPAAKPVVSGQDPAAVKKGEQATPAATSAPAKQSGAEKPVVSGQDPQAEKKGEQVATSKSQQVTGTIEALDAAAGTFTVKGMTGTLDLKAGKKVKLTGFKVGDKVSVKYADGTASSVKAVKGKESVSGQDPAAVKKGEQAAPAPAPAAPPAKK
jgi:hypothetical protein